MNAIAKQLRIPAATPSTHLPEEMSILAPTYKFTVEEYHHLAETGLLTEDDRIELLNGELIIMHAVGQRHASAVTNLITEFMEQARRGFKISAQNPVWIDEISEPEPDVVLVPGGRKRSKHPTPDEVFLIIEVSDSSLRYDRRDKMRAYARNGIREFWILNLEDNGMEIFREPDGETYAHTSRVGTGDTISPLAFPDVEIVMAEIIP